MALPTSFYGLTINDNTVKDGKPESTSVQLPIIPLTPANVAATQTLAINLENAIDGITIGEMAKSEIVYDRDILSADPAPSQLAQRENKWLMRYHGTTLNEKFRASIGTADLTQLPNNSEFLDLTVGVGLALKTAFEAVVRSPGDGAETVVLDSVQFVGRNT
jgi:hypothetical protein